MELLKNPKQIAGIVLTAILTTSVAPAVAIKTYRFVTKPFANQARINELDLYTFNLRRDLDDSIEEIKRLRGEINEIERRLIFPLQRDANRTNP